MLSIPYAKPVAPYGIEYGLVLDPVVYGGDILITDVPWHARSKTRPFLNKILLTISELDSENVKLFFAKYVTPEMILVPAAVVVPLKIIFFASIVFLGLSVAYGYACLLTDAGIDSSLTVPFAVSIIDDRPLLSLISSIDDLSAKSLKSGITVSNTLSDLSMSFKNLEKLFTLEESAIDLFQYDNP